MTHRYPIALVAALLVVPGAAASHDNDPLPDNTETIVCGSPDVENILGLLMGLAGACTDGDYGHLFFDATESGPVVCDVFCHQDLVVLPQTQVFAGHDVEPVPLPPEGVPAVPVTTPPVNVPIVRVQQDPEDSLRYCITVVPEEGEPDLFCFGVGPLVAPLLEDIVPIEQLDIPGVDESTPPVDEGQAGSTPSQHAPSVDIAVSLGINWAPDRLYSQASISGGDYYTPVNLLDPDELEWWGNNGDETSLDFTVTVFLDDAATPFPVTIPVPFAGQTVAAALASNG